MLLHVDANLTINGKALEVYSLGMSPSGKAKGPVVHIPNLGCDKVCIPKSQLASLLMIKSPISPWISLVKLRLF